MENLPKSAAPLEVFIHSLGTSPDHFCANWARGKRRFRASDTLITVTALFALAERADSAGFSDAADDALMLAGVLIYANAVAGGWNFEPVTPH